MSENDHVIKLDSSNFDSTINGDKPVLVDFFATWCGPCQMMLPVIHEMAKEEANKDFSVATLDIDDNAEIAAKYDVMSVPSFIVFKNGQEVSRMLGAMPKDMIVSKIREAIK